MPRDGSGVYTLPVGNPVVTNTVITSTWANTTLSDIAAQLNNVYTRDGTLGPTGPFKVVDGTVAAPGIAWNSEPGLGFFRPQASLIGFAAQGAYMAYLSGTSAVQTSFVICPRTAGKGNLTVMTQPNGSANFNALNFSADTAGLNIATSKAGTASALGLYITNGDGVIYTRSPAFEVSNASGGVAAGYAQLFLNKGTGANDVAIIYGSKNGVSRWNVQLGGGTVESGANAGSDFSIDRCNDAGAYLGTPFSIQRSTGLVNVSGVLNVGAGMGVTGYLTLTSGPLTVSAGNISVQAGNISVTGGVYASDVVNAANNIVAPTFYLRDATSFVQKQGNGNVVFQMAGSWYWVYDATTGTLLWRRGNGVGDTIIENSGTFSTPGDIYSGAPGTFGLISSDANLKYLRFSSNNWRLEHTVANGALRYVNYAGSVLFEVAGGGNVSIPQSSLWVGAGIYSNTGETSASTFDARAGIRSRQGTTAGGNYYTWWWNGPANPAIYCFVDGANQGWATLNVSDERAKQDIEDLVSNTDSFMAIRPISFRWNWPLRDPEPVQAGFSAQNMATVLPTASVGNVNSPRNEDGTIDMPASVDTNVILAYTVAEVQKLINRVNALEAA